MKYNILFFLFTCFAFAQPSVDFKTAKADISIDTQKKMVSGRVAYSLKVLTPVDTIKIDAHHMVFTDIRINGKNVKYVNSGSQLLLVDRFKKGDVTLTLNYSATPKQTMYFIGWDGNRGSQIWTQGQGKNSSHWIPSFDDVNEKVIFNMSVTFDANYTVLSNGVLKNVENKGDQKTWHYAMQQPMSSYLLMLAIGDFAKRTDVAASGIPLEYYLEPEDSAKFEPTYRYTKQMFDYLESEIGVGYPWEVYRQVPVKDFLYGGMENTTATVFTKDYVVDSVGFNDRNYVNVNAHELAHQWFGDMVTAKTGKDHWLQEGFATYYALLAEKAVFGDDYFNWKLYEMAENLQQAAQNDTIPILNAKASSLTFYQKGAWALHVLRTGVGEKAFQKAVSAYLQKYRFQNVDTDQFLAEINKVSKFDTSQFKERWLETSGFEVSDAIAILNKNAFMKQYFELIALADAPLDQKMTLFQDILGSDAYHPLKQEVIFQTQPLDFDQKVSLLHMAMRSDHVKVRQAVAKTLNPVPESFRKEYETLLSDNSYITQEIALNVLWSQFVDHRIQYLDKTSHRVGMNDKNIRILWLTMALVTADYQNDRKASFYDELLTYTKPPFESSVRMNAIETLLYINKNDTNVLESLVIATVHHKWQLTRFAREKIRELVKNPVHRAYFEGLTETLSTEEKIELQRLLAEKS